MVVEISLVQSADYFVLGEGCYMTVSTLPVWAILTIIGFIALIIVASNNYHLSKMDKLRARCLMGKPAKQRNNNILSLKRFIGEEYYSLMAFAAYVVITICFCVENHRMILYGDHLVLRILISLSIWFALAIFVTCFMVALMMACQDNAIKDLKGYYQKHYGVTVVNIDKDDEEAYYEYSEL